MKEAFEGLQLISENSRHSLATPLRKIVMENYHIADGDAAWLQKVETDKSGRHFVEEDVPSIYSRTSMRLPSAMQAP